MSVGAVFQVIKPFRREREGPIVRRGRDEFHRWHPHRFQMCINQRSSANRGFLPPVEENRHIRIFRRLTIHLTLEPDIEHKVPDQNHIVAV